MTISAAELFERYAARQEKLGGFRGAPPWFERASTRQPSEPPSDEPKVLVSGTVERTLLGADKAARIVLRADARGLATVVCRCTSDEVLWQVAPADAVRIQGVVRGLEDSLTLVMELCELVGPKKRRAAFLHILPGGRELQPALPEAPSCNFCGSRGGEQPPRRES